MLMSLSIGTYLNGGVSEQELINMLSEAGFTAMDFSFFCNSKYCDESTGSDCTKKEHFITLRKMAEDKGLVFNQAHAPMPSSVNDEETNKKIFTTIVTSMRNASTLGAKTIVVHPCQHLRYHHEGVPEALFEYNMKFYNALKPYCEEYGIKVALENMYQSPDGKYLSYSACAKPSEFISYLDNLDKSWFTACLDIGHAKLVGENPADFIRTLGAERLTALHIHDVSPNNDLHVMPYSFVGIINWDEFCAALKNIGYTGDFTFEAGNSVAAVPKALYPAVTKMMAETGKYLISKIEE